MAKSSRTKGLRGEQEVARIWRRHGFEVRGLEGSGDHLIVCGGGLVLHSETKRHERVRLPEWIRQAAAEAPAEAVPLVVWRQSRMPWRVDCELERLAGWLAEARLLHAPKETR